MSTDLRLSVVPEWVLDADISDRALRLYATLARYADADNTCYPSRRTLAERLRCSLDSIDRAIKELEAADALTSEPRIDDAGDRTSNLYTIHRLPRGSRNAAATGSRTGAAQNENHQEEVCVETPVLTLTAKEPQHVPRARENGWKVDRRNVAADHAALSEQILGEWNRQTGQSLCSRDWLAKIVMRIREHPGMTSIDHANVIAHALAHPWWDGPPSPSVVYGSGAQFERALTAARAPALSNGNGNGKRRFGYGVTSSELGQWAAQLRSQGR